MGRWASLLGFAVGVAVSDAVGEAFGLAVGVAQSYIQFGVNVRDSIFGHAPHAPCHAPRLNRMLNRSTFRDWS
eukprot:m.240071 g.240071  ORF g.240071 m.240071 type:complete len:73 (+) comp15819_c0_seq1:216-434(+)